MLLALLPSLVFQPVSNTQHGKPNQAVLLLKKKKKKEKKEKEKEKKTSKAPLVCGIKAKVLGLACTAQ